MENLVIGGKNYISSKRAAELMGYTQDYIGQLARSGKISAERVSGVWYVNEDEFSGLSKETNKKETFVNDSSNTHKTNSQKQSEINKDKSDITLDGVDYISSKRASLIMGYTQDYIGQLCRNKKIEARQVGRGWYIPRSVVYKNKDEDIEKKVTEKIENHQFQKPEKEKRVDSTLHKKEEVKIEHKEEQEKNDYYYPSFLNASYSFDDTPLVPTPKRTREPILHQIITEDDDITENVIEIQKAPESVVHKVQRREIRSPRKVQSITRDILEPEKHELIQKPSMSLMKIASAVVAILLFTSGITFIPHISVFNSNTGVLKTVFALNTPINTPINTPASNTLMAEVASSISTTPSILIETIISIFTDFFEAEIEYKTK